MCEFRRNELGEAVSVIMNDLYGGKLSEDKLENALKEINDIRLELSNFKPNKVVWDVDDLKKTPPWENDVSEDITNLAEYFVTVRGQNLFDVLINAISEAMAEEVEIEVKAL